MMLPLPPSGSESGAVSFSAELTPPNTTSRMSAVAVVAR